MAKKRIRSLGKARPNPSSGGGGLGASLGAGATAYATTRLAGRIMKGIAGPGRPGMAKAGKVAAAAAAVAAAYYLPKISAKLARYRTFALVGAVIALMQAVVEEYVPSLGGLLDVGAGVPAARQIAAAQAQSGYARRQTVADQLASGRRTTLRSKEDDYYDAMDAAEQRRSGRGEPEPPPQAQYVPPPPGSAQSNGQASDGPGPEYDDEDEFSNGIFGPN